MPLEAWAFPPPLEQSKHATCHGQGRATTVPSPIYSAAKTHLKLNVEAREASLIGTFCSNMQASVFIRTASYFGITMKDFKSSGNLQSMYLISFPEKVNIYWRNNTWTDRAYTIATIYCLATVGSESCWANISTKCNSPNRQAVSLSPFHRRRR